MTADLVLFLTGASIGSFLNACIYRLPRGLSVISPPSTCTDCDAPLRWFELIPVVSYVLQKGLCSHCSHKISIQYPIIEIISGLIVFVIAHTDGLSWFSMQTLFLMFLMLGIAVIDWRHFIIPNEMLVVGLTGGCIIQAFVRHEEILPMLGTGAMAGFLVYLIARAGNYIFNKQTMGIGDIKLSALIGFFLGIKLFVFTVWVAALLGTLLGLSKIILFGAPKNAKLPFGSLLATTAVFAFLLRDSIFSLIDAWMISTP